DLVIGGAVHSTHRVYYSSGEAVKFDISGITRSTLGRPTISDDREYGSDSIRVCYLKVRNFINDVQVGEEESSSIVLYWKSRLKTVDFVNWNPSDWVYKKFLTNYPRDEQRLIFPGDR